MDYKRETNKKKERKKCEQPRFAFFCGPIWRYDIYLFLLCDTPKRRREIKWGRKTKQSKKAKVYEQDKTKKKKKLTNLSTNDVVNSNSITPRTGTFAGKTNFSSLRHATCVNLTLVKKSYRSSSCSNSSAVKESLWAATAVVVTSDLPPLPSPKSRMTSRRYDAE